MDRTASLNHSRWECKYHVVFIPKKRRKTLYGALRKHLGEVFHRLARQKESRIEGGTCCRSCAHTDFDSAEVCRVASDWLHQGEERDPRGRVYGEQKRNFVGQHFWARGYFVSTVRRDESVIREYIRPQEAEAARLEQMNMWRS